MVDKNIQGFIASGEYEKGREELQRAYQFVQGKTGKEGVDAITNAKLLNNLAVFYDALGEVDQAKTQYNRSLAELETVSGADLVTAHVMDNLAFFYLRRDTEQAQSWFERSMRLRQKVMGEESEQVARSLYHMGYAFHVKKRYDEARLAYQRSLSIRESVLGKMHVDVARSLNGLALIYAEMGDYDRATQLMKRALKIRESILGQTHPETLDSVLSLGSLYESSGNHKKALTFYLRGLGTDNVTLKHFANRYKQLSKYHKSKDLREKYIPVHTQH